MKNFSIITLLATILLACGGAEQTELPTKSFADEYTLQDFNLNNNYQYWEIRKGNDYYQNDKHTVLQKYDNTRYSALSAKQVSRLNNIQADNGYDSQCQPGYCPVYGVAILEDSVFTIESETDLLVFFDEIDTEAELYVYLSKRGSVAKSYEENMLGYKAVVSWDNLCGTRGENLVQVHRDGSIDLLREISTTEYDGCI